MISPGKQEGIIGLVALMAFFIFWPILFLSEARTLPEQAVCHELCVGAFVLTLAMATNRLAFRVRPAAQVCVRSGVREMLMFAFLLGIIGAISLKLAGYPLQAELAACGVETGLIFVIVAFSEQDVLEVEPLRRTLLHEGAGLLTILWIFLNSMLPAWEQIQGTTLALLIGCLTTVHLSYVFDCFFHADLTLTKQQNPGRASSPDRGFCDFQI